MTRIVILDGYTLNPGDLDWSGLAALGDLVVYDRTAPAAVVERSRGAEIVLTNKTPLSGETLAQLPELKAIGVLATGFNVVDTGAARARGIPVMNVPGYGTAAVAQHVFALLLELTQRSGHHSAEVHDGAWSRHADWCFWNFPLVELSGLTMGIVGLGSIGRQAAAIARAFGMTTVALARAVRAAEDGVEFLERGEFLAKADVISLHCPLVPGNTGMVNAEWLRAMKPSAYLINTARGPLIDEAALAAALRAGEIAGAGLDVLSVEPPPGDHPLLGVPNCVITPHLAWAARASRARLLATVVENVRSFLAGQPRHVVNPA
jgi:glycerate dehydrogenase